MSITRNPVLGGGRVRDDLDLGGPGQEYLVAVQPRTADAATTEALAAAQTVSLTLLAQSPHLNGAEHLQQTRAILFQLGLLDLLTQPQACAA